MCALACKSIHVVPSGTSLVTTNGSVYQTPWVKVVDYSRFSVSCILVGGSPVGVFKLQQSNDLEADLGSNYGTGGGTPQYPVTLSAGQPVPRWADPYRPTQWPSDAADCLAGTGLTFTPVESAGVYLLNQYQVGYSWFRVTYTSTAATTTALSMYATLKS